MDTALRPCLAALPALAACSLAWNEFGSILARDWLPYAVVVALLVTGLLWSGHAQRPPLAAALGVVALLALASWDALSLRWSPVPALARDEALLVVLYALAFVVPLLVLRSESEQRAATALVAASLVALALVAFVALLVVERPAEYYEHGRLTFPISYVNAQAALFLVAFWPCVVLASERATHLVARGAAIGGASALLAGWLMTQSKGGLLSIAIAGIAFFALSPARLRAVLPAFIPAALVGGSYWPLTRPFRERDEPGFADAIGSASRTALLVAAGGALIGLLYALIDRRVSLSSGTERRLALSLAAALVTAVIALPVTFFAAVDRPGHFLETKWESFKTLPAHERGSSHLTSLGSNRYDFWRVELDDSAKHPVAGIGARGFAASYLLRRRSEETPVRGHSLLLDALSETGLIGFGLLAAAIGIPLGAAIASGRRSALVAGLAAAGVYGFVHASVDWTWSFPAVGLPLFALLGIASARVRGRTAPLLGTRHAVPLGVIAVALAIGAFGLPLASARLSSAALEDPANAGNKLKWARRLDPLSVEPFLAEATVAGPPANVLPLERAVAKEPRRAGLHYLLGRAYLAAGRNRAAHRELLEAQRLNPRDPFIRNALRRAP